MPNNFLIIFPVDNFSYSVRGSLYILFYLKKVFKSYSAFYHISYL